MPRNFHETGGKKKAAQERVPDHGQVRGGKWKKAKRQEGVLREVPESKKKDSNDQEMVDRLGKENKNRECKSTGGSTTREEKKKGKSWAEKTVNQQACNTSRKMAIKKDKKKKRHYPAPDGKKTGK